MHRGSQKIRQEEMKCYKGGGGGDENNDATLASQSPMAAQEDASHGLCIKSRPVDDVPHTEACQQ